VVGRRHPANARNGAPTTAPANPAHRAPQARARLHRLRGRDRGRHRRRPRRTRRRRRLRAVRRKTRAFLVEHEGNIVIEKIHHNRPLTTDDLAELEHILAETGICTTDDLQRAVEDAGSLGLFIRRLVGLDRAAAKDAPAEFLDDKRYTANQIDFVSLIIDELTDHGIVEPRRTSRRPVGVMPCASPCAKGRGYWDVPGCSFSDLLTPRRLS
jgi:hypothetical protein